MAGLILRRCTQLQLALAVAFAGVTACRRTSPVDSMADAVGEFTKAVDEYVALRNRLADSVGKLDQTWSQAQIAERAANLGKAIIAARDTAKPGDLFTPRAGTVFATLIKQEYSRRPPRITETRGDQQEELPDFVPQVNQIYPTTYPLATFPPELLPLLPKLPQEVEYRIVQHYLILRDIEANLIVDFMPHAVPAQ
jgi:hypothetical protein